MTQHSPTPWRVDNEFIYDGEGDAIVDLDDSGANEADVAFIIDAVNSHASLKSENERLRAALEKLCDAVDAEWTSWSYEVDCIFNEARAALSNTAPQRTQT